jgi:hypothetical protein
MRDQVYGPPAPPEADKPWVPLTVTCLVVESIIGGGQSWPEVHWDQVGEWKRRVEIRRIAKEANEQEDRFKSLTDCGIYAPSNSPIGDFGYADRPLTLNEEPPKISILLSLGLHQ